MIDVLCGDVKEEQGTAEALGTVPIGVLETERGGCMGKPLGHMGVPSASRENVG